MTSLPYCDDLIRALKAILTGLKIQVYLEPSGILGKKTLVNEAKVNYEEIEKWQTCSG